MKKLSILFGLLLIASGLSAQPDNWYFSINMGGCFPLGTFATTNPGTANAGFAQRGFSLGLDATYPLSNHWGLRGNIMLNNNPADRNGIGTLMENRMKKLVAFTETEREFLTLTVDSWMSNSLVIGPVYTINFDRLAWDFHAMAGMNVAYLPNQSLLFSNPAKSWEYLQHNTNHLQVSLDLLAGSAIRMKVADKVQLKLEVDYQHANTVSKFEELRNTKQNSSVVTEHLNAGSVSIPREVVVATIGFLYYL